MQRSFINLGFESPALPIGVQTCPKSIAGSAILTSSDVPGWETTHGPGDIWCTNNGGGSTFVSAPFGTAAIDIWKSGEVDLPPIVSAEGNQHAELSAWEKSRLYQTVCLLQGEDVSWEFSHTYRDHSGETMEFNIYRALNDEALEIARARLGETTCLSGTCNPVVNFQAPPPAGLTSYRNDWTKHSGTFTWTGLDGNYQFGFEGITDGATPDRGNLLDAIQLDGLKPFVELSRPDYESVEGAPTDSRLALLVSGNFTDGNKNPIAKTIQVRVIPVTAGTADYTSSAILNVVVPQKLDGGYDSQPVPFHDQIAIVADSVLEGIETFELEIVEDPSFLLKSTTACGGAGNARATYSIGEAALSVTKTATVSDGNGDPRTYAGDTINYVVTVTNTGTVPLTNVSVTDSLVPLSGGGVIASLSVGQSVQLTGSYVVTQTDMDNGQVANTVTAVATAVIENPPATVSVSAEPAIHTQPLDIVTTLDFIKSVRPDPFFDDVAPANGYLDAGERVWFDFTLTNTGTVVANVTGATDSLPGFVFQPASPTYTLNPGQSAAFSGYYTATQAAIDSGEILNEATASYTAAQQNLSVTSRSPTGGPTRITIPVPPLDAVLAVTKEVVSDTIVDDTPQPGDVLQYQFTVTNVSNVTVENPTIVDPLLGVNVTSGALPPVSSGNNVRTFGPYAYTLGQEDIDRGFVDNTVTVNGSIRGTQTVSATARNIRHLSAHPEVDLLKEATFVNLVGSPLPEAGDRIDFRFSVTNTGNITIDTYEITDAGAVLTMTRMPPPLLAGQADAETYVGSRIITVEDVNAGFVENVAYLTGTASDGQPVMATSHGPDGPPTRLVLPQSAGIAVTLQGTWIDANGNQAADPGETVEYAITITNNGNVALSAVEMTGLLPSEGLPPGMAGLRLAVGQTLSGLAAGQSAVVSHNHVLTQEDVDQGAIYTQIEVTGTGPLSMAEDLRIVRARSYDPGIVSSLDTDGDGRPDYPTEVKLPQRAKLLVAKSGRFLEEGPVEAGARILYQIEISNIGNVTLHDVYPVDLGIRFGGEASHRDARALCSGGCNSRPGSEIACLSGGLYADRSGCGECGPEPVDWNREYRLLRGGDKDES